MSRPLSTTMGRSGLSLLRPVVQSGDSWMRVLAAIVIGALVASLLAAVSLWTGGGAAPARAESNQGTAYAGPQNNTMWAYVAAGETLDVNFTKARIDQRNPPGAEQNVLYTVIDGGGTARSSCTIPAGSPIGTACTATGLTGTPGAWRITFTNTPPSVGTVDTAWNITVRGAGGAPIPGRVWTNSYNISQAGTTDNLQYWMINDTGYIYRVEFDGYGGIYSPILASASGNTAGGGSCAPLYKSTVTVGGAVPPSCGPYRIFFDRPALDLPPSAPSVNGTLPIRPPVLGLSGVVSTDMAFAPNASTPLVPKDGTFSYSFTSQFQGSYELQIDANGDGDYTDPQDRTITLGANGSGSYSYAFDGLDGTNAPIGRCTPLNARLHFTRIGEIHIVNGDVEARTGGIEVTRENGVGSGSKTVYWDDSLLPAATKTSTTPIIDGTAGIDSTGGKHGWVNTPQNPWGNDAAIDDWTYVTGDQVTGQLALPGTCLTIAKTSNFSAASRPGDTITYQVTATNAGSSAYTAANPAVVRDDLSGVIDDATYNGDASANQPGTVAYTAPTLSWTGALAAGASVTLTYTVTLKAGGNGTVRNVAWGDCTAASCPPPACDPPDAEGLDPATGLPCAELENLLPRLTLTKQASTNVLPTVGSSVTYTVTATNIGPGNFTAAEPASFTDDMSDVLDDGTLAPGSISASTGSAALTGTTLSWSGALAAGASVTVTYSVVYTGAGDQDMDNLACVPVAELADPTDPCRTVKIPGPLVQQRKTSDPASGTAVFPGQPVTYTLTFENTGQAAGAVSTIDDLSNVLDDATVTAGPTVSTGDLTATLNGTTLGIAGSVPAGATVTVTYTVTVKPFADQGNHILGNVLGTPGGPDECAADDLTCRTTHEIKALQVTKTSDAVAPVKVGDVVTYTVAVENIGTADFTAAAPASAVDDLAGVIDDAVYQNDAAATAGSVSYAQPTLTWTGALAVGATASFTYTVKVTNVGDHELRNTASIPPGLCPDGAPQCSDTTITLLPHVIVSKASDPPSGTAVSAGDVITYTLTYLNDGRDAGVVDSTDDLSEVLDDATITGSAVISSPNVAVAVNGGLLRVTGPIAVGETVTVSYTVTVKPDGERGNNIVGNVVVPDNGTGECVTAASCETNTRIGQLVYSKSVDPASGTTVAPGKKLTYTLTFENTGAAPVPVNHVDDLSGVLDDATVTTGPTASDPALSVSAITAGAFTTTGTLAPGQKATVTYTVTVNPDGQRTDDVLANILVPDGDPRTCNQAGTNCTVNYVSVVTATKTSDPVSGTQVGAGQKVTYTLTFTNTSTNPDAAPAAVAWTDHLANVLDDATLTSGPAASLPILTATVAGDQIHVNGSLASGQVATVTYTVTVKPYQDQGNHQLGNVISPTGEDPVCVPGNQLCTQHSTIKPPTGLAQTGADITAVGNTALLLLLLGGAIVWIGKRRRRSVNTATVAHTTT